MQNSGGMFQFAIFTHGGSFAITFDRVPWDPESRDCALREQFTEFFANVHQLGQVLDVFAGTGILDNCHASRAPRRRLDGAAHFGASFFYESCEFADFSSHFAICFFCISQLRSVPTASVLLCVLGGQSQDH